MPTYTAPVRETRFILDEVLDIGRYSNLPGLRQRVAGPGRGDPRGGGQVRAEVLQPLNRVGDEVGLQARRRRLGHDAAGLQGGLSAILRGRLADADRARGIWRAGPAAGDRHGGQANISCPPTTASKCTRG